MRIVCPLCEKVLQDGTDDPSHVMCDDCAADYKKRVEEELATMDDEERLLDALRDAFDLEEDSK